MRCTSASVVRSQKNDNFLSLSNFWTTGSPRYSRTFYLRICLFTFEKWPKMTILQSKMDFLSANSRFAVQNDGTYLPRITRETCTFKVSFCSLPAWAIGSNKKGRTVKVEQNFKTKVDWKNTFRQQDKWKDHQILGRVTCAVTCLLWPLVTNGRYSEIRCVI